MKVICRCKRQYVIMMIILILNIGMLITVECKEKEDTFLSILKDSNSVENKSNSSFNNVKIDTENEQLYLIEKNPNEEVEIISHNYSKMLKYLNANPMNGEFIERRHKFVFKSPDNEKKNKSKKNTANKKETQISTINNKNNKNDTTLPKQVMSYVHASEGFLTLD
jgi:hypothetical protein